MRGIGLMLLSLGVVLAAPGAEAASKRECTAACAQQILVCQDACVPFGGGFAAPGGRKLVRGCRAGVLKRCRKEGVQTCQTPAQTTTTSSIPGVSSTTTSTTVLATTSTLPPTTTTTTAPPSGLAGLIGRWRFQYTIISTFTATYDLIELDTVDGIQVLLGLDELGDLVIVGRTVDFGGGVPFEFVMLDPGIILCDFYLFNRTSATTISGEYWATDVEFDGSCGDLIGGPYPLSGTRLSTLVGGASRTAPAGDPVLAEALRVDEAGRADGGADDARNRILEGVRDRMY